MSVVADAQKFLESQLEQIERVKKQLVEMNMVVGDDILKKEAVLRQRLEELVSPPLPLEDEAMAALEAAEAYLQDLSDPELGGLFIFFL